MRDAILLFDVDGTLLQAGNRFHHQSLLAAVERLVGREPQVDQQILAGRTDTEILQEMVLSTGAATSPDLLPRLLQAATEDFEIRCPPDLRDQVIPGVVPALQELAQSGAAMGLVTGNIEAIAWRKMAAAGLRQFFSFGAFGDESGRRADLPPLAATRAGRSFSLDRSYIIGDTPLDIDCGLACSMKTIAVATGRYSLDELRACRPSFVCANLLEFAEAFLAGRI